ncbi:restriction endonuclease subunit S [Vibrio crassostreae]|uniref:restriction endonuclease subunit S n=1 Tax=Vibrio crassostreae TaxID=246167 RepID=UPI00031F2416|nr:restriction endonuclease subunit S [Vibrio crassostreae]OED82694.1 type I restriction endonuclease subunit S [Vibrio crassostreae ZF-91]
MSELPKGWVTCTPSELANDPKNEIVDGPFGSNLKASEYTDEGTPIVRIQNVKRMAFLNKNIKYVTDEKAEFLKRHSFKSGDLLLTKLGEPLGLTCIAPEYLNEGIIVADIVRLRPNPEVNRKCLAFLLNSEGVIKQINAHTRGSTRARINLSVVRNLNINLPPLAEQKRIVEKLDEVLAQVDTIKARLDGIPDLLKRFRQSVLASAVSGKLTEEWRGEYGALGQDLGLIERIKVGLINDKTVKKDLNFEISNKIFDIPDAWSFLKLKSLASKITDGEHKTPKREESGRYLLSARNVRDGYLSLDNVDYVGEEEYQKLRKRCDPNKGDILISCSGSVGRISLVDTDDKYVMVRSAALVKVIADFLLNSYLVYVLQSPELQKRIDESSKSTAQSNLFLGPIKELEIPLPSIEEQKEIVRLVDQYFAFADTIEAQVKKAQARVDNLTQSILAKAFRGELVAQDPNDEPADKLLARIAEARKEAEALAKAAKKAEAAKKRAAKSA